MTQEVLVGEDKILLDSAIRYSGTAIDKKDNAGKLIRKAIGLPVAKPLVYYKDKRDASSVVAIKSYQLVEMFDVTEKWYTVEASLEDDSIIRIMSWHLIEMQKPSFITDMAVQDASNT